MFLVDSSGHILDRLARSWTQWGHGVHDFGILFIGEHHPYALRRAGARTGMLHWVVSHLFAGLPRAAWVPQTVMVHHLTRATSAYILRALPSADAITTGSERWRRRLSQTTGRNVFHVPYTLDAGLFRPGDRGAARIALNIDASRYVIGFSAKASSNVDGRKGPELFASIAEEAGARWSDTTVLIVGGGWAALAERLRARGVDVRHVVPATTEETAALYPAMDVFLCTSSEEGGPCTILEAMACAVPVVTTDVGHVPEVIRDRETGFIIEEHRTSAFMDRIAELRSSRTRSNDIAAAGREFIVAERDDRARIPRIDFEAIHASARLHFTRRPLRERAGRFLPRLRLGARYAARRILSTR
jgi:glycosyltransferase involved in cell wall biosynthesis